MTRPKNAPPLWVQALLDKRLSYTERLVLMYLAWRQGRNDSAWPAQDTIGADLGLTGDGIRKIVRRLAAKGWLIITRPVHTGPGQHLAYRVILPTEHPDGGQGDSANTQTTVGVNTRMAVRNNTTGNTTLRAKRRGKRRPGGEDTPRGPRQPFVPPTVKEVEDYASERGDPQFEAGTFIEYYTRTGWRRKNGTRVLDWKATVREWMKRNDARRIERGEPPHDGYSQYGTHLATEQDMRDLVKAGVFPPEVLTDEHDTTV